MKEGWEYKKLGEICDFISGFTPKKEELNSISGIPYFKVSDMNRASNELYLTETELYVSESKKTIPARSIVFPKNGGAIFTGKKRILLKDSIVDLNTEGIKIKDAGVTLEYLYKLLLGVDFGQFDNGGGLPSINIKRMKEHIIPVPPLSEQQRIVDLLDAELDKIDLLKTNAEHQLKAAKDLYERVIEQIFSDSEKWSIISIGDCFVSINNGANIKQTKGATGIPITRIETLANSVFNSDRLGYANIEDASKFEKYIMKDGDLLMSHINSVEFTGRTVAYHNQVPIVIHGMNLLRLVPRENVDSDFFVYLTKTKSFKDSIRSITHKSVNQASFNTTALKAINIKLPNLEEQQKIASRLDSLSEHVKQLQANYEQTITLCNDLKQALLKSIFE